MPMTMMCLNMVAAFQTVTIWLSYIQKKGKLSCFPFLQDVLPFIDGGTFFHRYFRYVFVITLLSEVLCLTMFIPLDGLFRSIPLTL